MGIEQVNLGLNSSEYLDPAIGGHRSPLGMHESGMGYNNLFAEKSKGVVSPSKGVVSPSKGVVSPLDLNNGNYLGNKAILGNVNTSDDVLKKTYEKYKNPTTKEGEAIFKQVEEEMQKRGLIKKQVASMGFLSKIKNLPWKNIGKFGAIAALVGAGLFLLSQCKGCSKTEETPTKPVAPVKPQPQKPIAEITENTEKDYHSIKTGGMTWAGIVQAYYPGLVEKCDGKLYGQDGAIRKLKEALSKCDDIDLVNASDIPKTLNLPLELDGVKINKDANAQTGGITQKGGHTDIEKAGCENTKTTYTATDKKNKQSFTWHDEKAVVDSLKARTGVKEYEVRKAS